MKEFFYHKPYGKAKLFKEKVETADFDKLAKLIKIMGCCYKLKFTYSGARVEAFHRANSPVLPRKRR